MSKRIEWIDIAKGIGILYVVMSHIQLGFLSKHVCSFYMPFFFFLSGLVFNIKKNPNFFSFVKKKAKTLLKPYFINSFLFLITYVLLKKLPLYDVKYSLYGIFYSRYRGGGVESGRVLLDISNNALWFLTSLFIVCILYYLIEKISKNKIQTFIYSLTLLILGIFLNKISPILLPWNLDTSLICVSFYALGNLTSNSKIFNIERISTLKVSLILVISFIINIICIKYNGDINLSTGVYSNFSLFYVGALSGIFMYVCISIIISRYFKLFNTLLSYLGGHTMNIMIYHMIILNLIIYPIMNRFPILYKYNNNLSFGFLCAIVIILAILIVEYFIKKIKSLIRLNMIYTK